MIPKITITQELIAEFCERWEIEELSLFGSVLRDDFSTESDVDLLVKFHENSEHSLFDMVKMKDELQQLLGTNVDIVSRRAIEMSRNTIRKKAILESAEVVYGA